MDDEDDDDDDNGDDTSGDNTIIATELPNTQELAGRLAELRAPPNVSSTDSTPFIPLAITAENEDLKSETASE